MGVPIFQEAASETGFGKWKMSNIHNKHIRITENVKQIIGPLKVVVPSHYGRLYTEAARSLDVELQPEEILNSEMLSDQVVHHVITLAACTEQAIEAIETEDKKTLYAVLAETRALREEIRALQTIVYEDPLTRSYNRRWFEDNYLNNDKRTLAKDGTMAIIDLNKFKEINDTFGHIVGDKVLVHISQKLKESGGDVIRYGGDEFLVVFGAAEPLVSVQHKIELMILNCSKRSFKIENESFKISFAFGITPFKQGNDFGQVIDVADKAMYRHKRITK